MTCLTVDDNAMARAALRHLIEDLDFLELQGESEDAIQAIKFLQENPVDLLFLDVEMPLMNGLELIRILPHKPLVILVTSKRDYAVEAFDLQVIDYLVKPITFPRFMAAVQRAQEIHRNKLRESGSLNLEDDHIFFKTNNTLVRVQLTDILFFQALGDYVTLVSQEKRYTLYAKMKAIESRLPGRRFIRTHRSYIVAVGKIDNIEENSIQIGKHLIPISDTYRAKVLSQLKWL